MITLLAKWLVRKEPTAQDAQVRDQYTALCGALGIALNLLLVAGKLIAGLLTRSIAITADALNNLSDAGSSLLTIIGVRLARQRPDEGHPFGHGRMEYISGLLIAVVILLMGAELLKTSVERIASPAPTAFSALSIAILAASIGVKLYMYLYNRRIGRAIDSAPLRAVALDSLSDVAATSVVLIATLVGHFTGLMIDGWCGAAVSLFILYAGFTALKDTVSLLLGTPPTPEYIDHISAIVRACPEVIGMHDLMIHDYGPGRRVVTLHAEVPASGDILALHDAVDNLEKELQETLGCTAIIHMDPIDTDDELTAQARLRVAEVVKGLDERVTIHDFRMVSGPTHTNLIFDVCIPFDVALSDAEIRRRIGHMIHALDDTYFAVVTVDRGL